MIKNQEIVDNLIISYWMEIETVMNYIANSIKNEGNAYEHDAIANFMEFIRQDRDPYITGDGEQTRDMAHLEDVVSANIFL